MKYGAAFNKLVDAGRKEYRFSYRLIEQSAICGCEPEVALGILAEGETRRWTPVYMAKQIGRRLALRKFKRTAVGY